MMWGIPLWCSNSLFYKSKLWLTWNHPYVDVSPMNHCALWLLIYFNFLYHQIKNAGKTNLVFDLLRVLSTPQQWSAIDCKCFCYTVICFNHLTFQTLWQTPVSDPVPEYDTSPITPLFGLHVCHRKVCSSEGGPVAFLCQAQGCSLSTQGKVIIHVIHF